MNEMNENITMLRIVDFIGSDEAWGRDLGRKIYRLIEDEIFRIEKANPGNKVFVFDLSGLKKMDASFPQEAIVEILRKFRSSKYFILMNIDNQAIEENMSMAFEKRNEVGLVRDAHGFRAVGAPLAQDFKDIIKLAENKGCYFPRCSTASKS
jgi:hypothetical protein